MSQWSYFKMPLYQRLIVAAVSGGLVGFIWEDDFFISMVSDNSGELIAMLLIYGIPGAIFSLTVMVPFLSARSIHWFRVLALIGVSSVSYGFATETYDELTYFSFPGLTPVERSYLEIFSDRFAFEIAGLVGALIVGIGGVMFLRMKIRWRFVLSIVVGGVLGGAVFDLTGGLDNMSATSHAAWQTLVCAALYVAIIDTRTSESLGLDGSQEGPVEQTDDRE